MRPELHAVRDSARRFHEVATEKRNLYPLALTQSGIEGAWRVTIQLHPELEAVQRAVCAHCERGGVDGRGSHRPDNPIRARVHPVRDRLRQRSFGRHDADLPPVQ